MPNKLVSNIFRIDTKSATTPQYSGQAFIKRIDYASYQVATNQVEIQDKNGNTICILKGDPTFKTVPSGEIGSVQGIWVPTTDTLGNPNMQSGLVLVYIA